MDYGNKYCPKKRTSQEGGMKWVGGTYSLLEKIVLVTIHCK